MKRIKIFVGELRHEFKRINWPSRDHALKLSVVVIVISLMVSVFLGALDYFFVTVLREFFQ